MDYPSELSGRVRAALAEYQIVEGPFMDGNAFWVDDKLVVSIHGDDLLVRVPSADYADLVGRAGCEAFEFAARPVPSWVLVNAVALANDDALTEWVKIGLDGSHPS